MVLSVAREIELEDKFENMGAQMVKRLPLKPMMQQVTVQRLRQFLLKLS